MTGIIRTAPVSKNPVLKVLHKVINAVIAVYVEVFRGTPMMVQAMVIYWGYAFAMQGQTLPLIPSGIMIVSVNTGAYMPSRQRRHHLDRRGSVRGRLLDRHEAFADHVQGRYPAGNA